MSKKQMTEEATTDFQQINPRVLANLKAHYLFVFYAQPYNNTLQKITMKIAQGKQGIRQESGRQLQLGFYNYQTEELDQGLNDFKALGNERKSRLIWCGGEKQLMQMIKRAEAQGVQMKNVPLIVCFDHQMCDLSLLSGWNELRQGNFYEHSMEYILECSKKWIQASQQRLDRWKVSLHFQERGRLQKMENRKYIQLPLNGSCHQQQFVSHFSIGHHAKVAGCFEQARLDLQSKKSNFLMWTWQQFKNFCCIGQSNLKTSTGVVSICFKDQKGDEVELLKHLREYEGSEESELQAAKVVRKDKRILSLLLANIDRYQGKKLQNCRPDDGRLDLILMQGPNALRHIGHCWGEVNLKLEGVEGICTQIGDSVYRLWGCKQISLHQLGRLRICINREVLGC